MSRSLTPWGAACCAQVILWLCAAPVFAADVQTLVSGRTDVRVRSPLPGDTAQLVTTDVVLLPSASVTLGFDTTLVALQYNPSILFREPQRLGPMYPLHQGRAALTHRFGRATLALLQEAAVGSTDVGALLSPEGTPPTNVATTQGAIPYERFASLATIDANPTNRTALTLGGGYLISGSPVQNESLPLQWGPVANARFRGTVTPRSLLITQATFMSAHFATGQKQLIVSLTESFERRLTRTLTGSLGGGVAEVISTVSGPLRGPVLLPVVLATLTSRDEFRHSPLQLTATARLGPFADRFTGLVYERVEALINAEWRFQKPWVSLTNIGVAYVVPVGTRQTQVGDRLYYGETGARWAPLSWLQLGALGRLVWVEQPRLAQPGQLQWLITFSATVRDERSMAW